MLRTGWQILWRFLAFSVVFGLLLAPVQLRLAVVLGALWLGGALAVAAPPAFPAGGPLAAALLGMLLNAVLQEVLVRGYPWRLVEQRAGPVAALLTTSVLFAALHAGAIGHWLPALNLVLAGLAFGAARRLTGGLALPIGLHAAWNALLGPVLGLVVSGQSPYQTGARLLEVRGPALWGGGAFGVEGGVATTVVTAGLAWWLLRRRPRDAAGAAARAA